MTGLDFSEFAIEYNRKHFPEYLFELAHLNLVPDVSKYEHILINDAFYHFSKPFRHIQQLLKSKPKSLYWVHNFKEEIGELALKGYSVEVTDYTPEFKALVNSWLSIIDEASVQEERKKYPLIWDTLEKEMKAHRQGLQNQKLQRVHIQIKKL